MRLSYTSRAFFYASTYCVDLFEEWDNLFLSRYGVYKFGNPLLEVLMLDAISNPLQRGTTW